MNDQDVTVAHRQSVRPKSHHVDFAGFLAFNPPLRVRNDIHKMIYDGIYTDEVHPSTWKFLRKHNLYVTLWGPGK
jgi:hypothetical protein